jgi:hypothetical protein
MMINDDSVSEDRLSDCNAMLNEHKKHEFCTPVSMLCVSKCARIVSFFDNAGHLLAPPKTTVMKPTYHR